MQSNVHSLPLAVDLDGTLCRTNTIAEQVMALLRARPWMIMSLAASLRGGRTAFKRRLQVLSPIERIALPFHSTFVEYLQSQSLCGREIILVTAAHQATASHVASLFPFFREGIGSDSSANLAGEAKADYVVQRYGEKGFVYAGNERRDLAVWKHAGGAVIVNPSVNLERAAARVTTVERVFEDRPARFQALIFQLRPHQWLKNILIFVPVFTAHRLGDHLALVHSFVAFAAFSAAASGAYVLNDLIDLPSDRAHAKKKCRPFASGDLPLEWGLVLFPLLLVFAAALSFSLPPTARMLLGGYVVLTLLYTFFLKKLLFIDVLVLATLYALRLVMGHVATGIPPSQWLTAFALCMFLSLALLKRFCELREREEGFTPGRGYHVDHRKGIGIVGIAVGCSAAVIIAFYAGSNHVATLYATPAYIYLLCPIFLVWILRMWRLGYAGTMHEDPVLFTLHDLFSVAIGVMTILVVLLAR